MLKRKIQNVRAFSLRLVGGCLDSFTISDDIVILNKMLISKVTSLESQSQSGCPSPPEHVWILTWAFLLLFWETNVLRRAIKLNAMTARAADILPNLVIKYDVTEVLTKYLSLFIALPYENGVFWRGFFFFFE